MGAFLPPPGQPDPKMDPKFRSGSWPAIVSFGFTNVGPPSPLYIQRDDVLVIQAFSNVGAEVVTVNGRLLLAPFERGSQPDGTNRTPVTQQPASSNIIESVGGIINIPSAGQSVITTVALNEGYLLSLAATCSAAATRGRTFVRAFLVRGGTTAAFAYLPLFADYVYIPPFSGFRGVVGWPGGRILPSIEGPGWLHSFQVTTPAAGADWSFNPTAPGRVRPQSVSALLTTSATVANRNVRIQVRDSVAHVLWEGSASASIAAATAAQVSATGLSSAQGVVATDYVIDMPPNLTIDSTMSIASVTQNLQVGDQWSNIWFLLEEWPEV